MAKQEIESEVTGNVWKVLKSVGDSVLPRVKSS